MKKFFVLFFLVLFSFSHQPVFADVISPPILSYQVEPGEEFEFDLVFYSQAGGDYDVLLRTFSFTPEGGQTHEDVEDGVLTLGGPLVHFDVGEEKYLPVIVKVPDWVNDLDLKYIIGLRKRTNSFDSFELSSVVILSVGEGVQPQGKILSSSFQFSESDPEVLSAVSYRFENSSKRIFFAIPQLNILNGSGDVLHEIKGSSRVFFPDFPDESSFVLKPKKEILLSGDAKSGVFQIISNGEVLDEVLFSISAQKKILAVENESSPLALSYRERRGFDFLYNPIFTRFAILIGLTLVAGSFLMRKEN